jgi:peptide/nickel transport system substrate-binding protein
MTDNREHHYVPTAKRLLAEGRVDRREFLRTVTLLGVSATAAYAFADKIAGVSGAAQAQTAPALPKGGTLRIAALIQDAKSPHTYYRFEQGNVSRQVCDYLMITGHDNVTRPALVEKWETSPDLKAWTFHLRKDVKWHDGRPFTADDVIWNLKRVTDPKVGSSMLGLMKGYMLDEFETGEKDDKGNPKKSTRMWDSKGFERVDAHTVRLNLKRPQLSLPEDMASYPFAIMDPNGDGTLGVGSKGTGAFDFVVNEPGRRIVLKARKDYWGGAPAIDQLEFIEIGDDATTAIQALVSGQIHGLTIAGIGQLNVLKNIPTVQLYEAPSGSVAVIRGRHNEKPWDNIKFRRALQAATDTEALLKIGYSGLGHPGEFHHVAPVHPEYAKLPPIKRDVAKAKALLAEAGHPNGIDMVMNCRTDPDWFSATAQAAIEQWKEAGIRVKLEVMPNSLYAQNWQKVPFGMTDWFHRPLGVQPLALAYRSGVPWNETNYSNPEFDKLLDQAEGTVDIEKRREVMAKLEKIMQDDAVMIPPFFRSVFTFMDKKVKGFKMHPSGYIFGNQLGVEA